MRRLRQGSDARMRGDIDAVVSLCTDDCRLEFSSWRGQTVPVVRNGREEVREILRQVNANYVNLGNTFNRVLIDGEKVALHRTAVMRNRGGGDEVRVDFWNFITFRGDKVCDLIEHPDTMMLRLLE